MNTNDYEHKWTLTEQERSLMRMAAEYHERCEQFDRNMVQSRAIRYGLSIEYAAQRLLPNELSKSNRNAAAIKKELMHRYNISSNQFKDAVQGYR